MIDSICLRLHGLKHHIKAVSIIENVEKSYSVVQTNENLKTAEQRDFIQYHDTGKYLMLTPFKKYTFANKKLGSHVYSIACKVDHNKDFIEFNFSIPKYLYGNNVSEFIKMDDFERKDGFKDNVKGVYENFFKFIDYFFRNQLMYEAAPMGDIEVVFIDICYNQYFDNKTDALTYFRHASEIKKKSVRLGSNMSRDWGTTISYKTKNQAFLVLFIYS